ncbi:ribosomal protein S18-alanine N-acetyltransferase [Dinoroseobacter sp. PD6]|uniref:ribosomal protein S18-alanine N-acetyltransferase n=1 Tax=Dinoroseobacter sp. PD6 TaxID=3028384 RepID=UPI00237A312D|nr:ribosomal protein S18-alanine N-acetyltransferase [Dinoroseobacter sp. PD6]MDD9716984.1 ribosomal protein S18-alanine N-acetyltransferase [Dinoroseobacter sp. PD6]
MTPAQMATLHAACFTTPRPWSEAEITETLARPGSFTITAPHGFALAQVAGPEAELLTLAVAPAARRQGIACALMARFHATARARGAQEAFLEVAADNTAARALYARLGYAQAGRRKGYYRGPDGARQDALVLRCPLHDS